MQEQPTTQHSRRLQVWSLVFLIVLIATLSATYLLTSPLYFRGEVLERIQQDAILPNADIFIAKTYGAKPGEIGEIELEATRPFTINGIQFSLGFDKNKITVQKIVKNNTPFQSFIGDINSNAPGGALIVLAGATPVTIQPGPFLKLQVKIHEDISTSSTTKETETRVLTTRETLPPGTLIVSDESMFILDKDTIIPPGINITSFKAHTLIQDIDAPKGTVVITRQWQKLDTPQEFPAGSIVLASTPRVLEATETLPNGTYVLSDQYVELQEATRLTTGSTIILPEILHVSQRKNYAAGSNLLFKEVQKLSQPKIMPKGTKILEKVKVSQADSSVGYHSVTSKIQTLTASTVVPSGTTIIFGSGHTIVNQDTLALTGSSILSHETFTYDTATPISNSNLLLYFIYKVLDEPKELASGTYVILENQDIALSADTAIPPGTTVITQKNVDQANSSLIPITLEDLIIIDGNLAELHPTVDSGLITISGDTVVDNSISITSISPSSINNNSSTRITIRGNNLLGSTVYLNAFSIDTNTSSRTEVSATVPKDFLAGSYSLSVTNNAGKSATVENALVITKTTESALQIVAEETQIVPPHIPNNGKTKSTLWVTLKDPLGVDDIEEVVVDLTAINGSPINLLTAAGKKDGKSLYTIDITVPSSVPTSNLVYRLPITARNKTGQSASSHVELLVTKKIVSSIRPRVVQAHASPKQGVSGKKVSLFVEVEDKDGVEDITSVIINLIKLGGGLGPIALLPIDFPSVGSLPTSQDTPTPSPTSDTSTDVDFTAPSSTFDSFQPVIERRWFALVDFVLPAEVKPSTYSLPITVTDRSGERASDSIRFTVLSQDELSIFGPKISSRESYTTPLATVNDEETPFTLNVLIEHSNPLESVIVNLGNVARAISPNVQPLSTTLPAATSAPFRADVFDSSFDTSPAPVGAPSFGTNCPTNSDTIVCMSLTAKIGNQKTWATLPNLVIRKYISPSIDPYLIEVIATDVEGQVSQGFVPVTVYDGEHYASDDRAPKVSLAVATTPKNIEILFSEPLNPASISPNGRDFTVTFEDDISVGLPVHAATINAAGTIVRLTTAPQEEARYYAVSVGTAVTDAIGIPIVRGTENKARFIGFVPSSAPLRLDYIASFSPNEVELEFYKPIRPSTLELTFMTSTGAKQAQTLGSELSRRGSSNFRIQDASTGKDLSIKSVRFGNNPNIIIIETDTQKAGNKYFVNVRDLATYSGKFVHKTGITKFFKGFRKTLADAVNAWNSADFNQDGKVDFRDFTVFATFYGKTKAEEIGEPETPLPPSTQPIPNNNPGASNTKCDPSLNKCSISPGSSTNQDPASKPIF